jgi:hypothetical protein
MENGKHEAATTDLLETSALQKYAPTLASAAITVFGGLQVLVSTGHSLPNVLVFLALLITTTTTFALPGKWKVILEAAGVVVAAVLPFAIAHTVNWASALLIAVAVTKALATAFGVKVRTDSALLNASQSATGAYTVTTLPAADPGILPDPADDDQTVVSTPADATPPAGTPTA